MIISHRGLTEPLFNPADLLISCHARDYFGSPYRHFDDALVFAQAANNGLLAELSNSFLVSAGAQGPGPDAEVDLAVAYSVDRVPEFNTETVFVRTREGIKVMKQALEPGLTRSATLTNRSILENTVGQAKYVHGELCIRNLLKARAESGSLQAVVDALRPWFEFIIRKAVNCEGTGRLSDYVLPGSCLDLTPFNLIETNDGLIPIDKEWKLNRLRPLGWVVTRSVLYSLRIGVPIENPLGSITDVIEGLCSAQNIEFSKSDVEAWLELEDELQAVILGRTVPKLVATQTSGDLLSFQGALSDRDSRIAALDRSMVQYQQALLDRDGKVEELIGTVSERDSHIVRSRELIASLEEKLSNTNSELDAQIMRSREMIGSLEAKLARAISARDAQIMECTAELTRTREVVALIYGSTSWRIAAPLRFVGRLVARVRRKQFGREPITFLRGLWSTARHRRREKAELS